MRQATRIAGHELPPSIVARKEKYDESRGIWQARVNRDWRFYFIIAGDVYQLIDVVAHPK